MNKLKKIFTPNQNIDDMSRLGIFAFYILFVGSLWFYFSSNILPSPVVLIEKIFHLFKNEGLGGDLIKSLILSVSSMMITVVFSLLIVYASTIPFFRPIGFVFSKGRFLGLKGIVVVFLLLFPSSYTFKIVTLVFGTSVFFITTMLSEIMTIEKGKFTHARTLGMGEWRVLYEVVILNKMERVIETIRQCYAISWMMIATVESYSIGEGGVGALLERKGKYIQNLPEVLAIQLVILLFAIFQDQIIGWFKNTICNWANLQTERK